MTTIDQLELSRFPPIVEKAVKQSVIDSLRNKTCVRCQIEGRRWRHSFAHIVNFVQNYGGCVLVQIDTGSVRSTYMMATQSSFHALEATEAHLGVVSFIFNDGALSVSFDVSVNEDGMYVHVVGWGSAVEYLKELSHRGGGSLY